MVFRIDYHTKWADFDANKHLRHTAYNDYAAACRIRFFNQHGFGVARFEKDQFGPVLFKEETTFLREVKLGEDIYVELYLLGASKKGERFKMFHKVYKKEGAILAAEISIYAAWIDLNKRKLAIPPIETVAMLQSLQKTEDFEEIFIKKS